MSTNEQRIYVACLASYNSGVLHGRWIDASEDVEDMQVEINAMLRASPVPGAEEWAIHDSEGLGDLGEYSGLEEVARRVPIGTAAEDWDIPPQVLLEAMSELGGPDEDPEDFIHARYHGPADDWAEAAYRLREETGDLNELPDWALYLIDWERAGRDMSICGDFLGIDHGGTLYIFWTH